MKKKIAVCLSGQPRTWQRCYPTWISALSHLGELDFFCHLWDYNSEPSLLQHEQGPTQDIKLSRDEMLHIRETINPVKLVFQSKKENVIVQRADNNVVAPWAHSQLYSLHRAALLKREHEITTEIEYDLVIRLRCDLVFTNQLTPITPITPAPSTVYTVHNIDSDPEFKVPRFSDIFFAADSLTFDHVCAVYRSLSFINNDDIAPFRGASIPPPEVALSYHCTMLGIRAKPLPIFDLKIARTEAHLAKAGGLNKAYETL